MGACRRQKLHSLQFSDVQDLKSMIFVRISNPKSQKYRTFTITGKNSELCKQCIRLRPNPCPNPSFFLNYVSGKCTTQNVGMNKFGNLVKIIASYLKLPNSELYTGHCFRRTSASLLFDTGGDIKSIRRLRHSVPMEINGGWSMYWQFC